LKKGGYAAFFIAGPADLPFTAPSIIVGQFQEHRLAAVILFA
jgi:hypothetical protein